MKRMIALLLAVALLCLTACGRAEAPADQSSSEAAADPESSSASAAEPQQEPEEQSSEPANGQLPEEESTEAPLPESSSAPEETPAEPSQPELPESSQEPSQPPAEEQPAPSQPASIAAEPTLPANAEFLDDLEIEVLSGINAQRSDVGVGSVQWDDNLARAARIRAAELYRGGYTAHTRPNGNSWVTVLKNDVPVNYAFAGEILASLQTQQNEYKIYDSDYWVTQWVNSQSHYECMVSGKYTHAGTAVLYAYDEESGLSYGYACTLFAAY